jgi:hypothetical protein
MDHHGGMIIEVKEDRNGASPAVALLILLTGAMVFVAGCIYAVIEDSSGDSVRDREDDLDGFIIDLIREYGSNSDSLDLQLMLADGTPGKDLDSRNGRPASIELDPMRGEDHNFFVPDEITVNQAADGPSSSSRIAVTLNVGDGSVVPAFMEVIIYE